MSGSQHRFFPQLALLIIRLKILDHAGLARELSTYPARLKRMARVTRRLPVFAYTCRHWTDELGLKLLVWSSRKRLFSSQRQVPRKWVHLCTDTNGIR